MLSDRQLSLINTCVSTGYGWRKFANSVKEQGVCSYKQEQVLIDMVQRILHMQAIKAGHFRSYGPCNISDGEAMRSGDYF